MKAKDLNVVIGLGLGLGLALGLVTTGCKRDPKPDATSDASEQQSAETGDAVETSADPTTLDRLLVYLPDDALAVAYDRLDQRLDPAVVEVVFALPPKAGDLLDERAMLDEGLDIVLDGTAEPELWLAPTSLAFTIRLANTPYILRPLTKPIAEVGPLLEQGFTKNTINGVDVWLPGGSFPWRVALLEGDIAAFIPIDAAGTGLEPLTSASTAEDSAVETQIAQALRQDPSFELLLISAGPLIHLDVTQAVAQVQFGLRRTETTGSSYEGTVVLAPTEDIDECLEQLRARKHPEENQQVQSLLSSVKFAIEDDSVTGRLAIAPTLLKHFLDR